MKSHSHIAGFTLVELLIGLSITAILLAIAVPSFREYITQNAVESLQDRLAAAVTFTRSEAATRNTVVTLCGSNNGTGCVASQWQHGWIVFVDNNANKVVDGADEILQSHQITSNPHTISFKEEGVGLAAAKDLDAISFTSQGFVLGEKRAFATFCAQSKEAQFARGLTVERSGRVMKGKSIAFDTGTGKADISINCT